MTDTDIYHLQIIRWNHEYGTIPGLANLYLRYGFYSNWLSLISLFALPFKTENYLYLNVTISTWFFLFLVQKLSLYLKQYNTGLKYKVLSWTYTLLFILMFIEWGLFRVNSSSTSYDFIVSVLTLFILLQITEEITISSFSSSKKIIPLVIISASVPFFKLSGIFIIPILFVYFMITKKKKIIFLAFTILIILFIFPFLYRNYTQTGFPVFPYTFFSWGNPDWQVPAQMANKIATYISLNNKYFNQQIPEIEWKHATFRWIKSWFYNIPLTNKLIILLTVTGLPVFVVFAKRTMKQQAGKIVAIYVNCGVALLIWFFLSPDPRFAYSYLLFMSAFPLSFLGAKFFTQRTISILLLIVSAGIIIYETGKFNAYNMITPEKIAVPEITLVKINNSTYNIPGKLNTNAPVPCYYSVLPCIYEINPYLEQRSNNLKDGFKMNKNIDSVFIMNYSY